jgi:glutamine synthetase
MSKPFFDLSGNGFHVHHSLHSNGKNLFADKGKLSRMGKQYLAGMQRHMCEAAAFSAPTPNSYRRRQPYSFCPVNNAWGVDNRTCGLRVIEGPNPAVRVEQRDGSADANPYLLLAVQIASGLKGIENGWKPGPQETGDGYANRTADKLPTDLGTAIELARNSELVNDVIDENLLGIYLGQAERELEFLAAQVTPVEQARYLRSF